MLMVSFMFNNIFPLHLKCERIVLDFCSLNFLYMLSKKKKKLENLN